MRIGPYFSYAQIENAFRAGVLRVSDLLVTGEGERIAAISDVFGSLSDTSTVPEIPTSQISADKITFSPLVSSPLNQEPKTSSPARLQTPAAESFDPNKTEGFMTLSGKIVHSSNYGTEIHPDMKHSLFFVLDFSWKFVMGATIIIGLSAVIRFLPDMGYALIMESSIDSIIPQYNIIMGYVMLAIDVALLFFWSVVCVNLSFKTPYNKFRFAVIKIMPERKSISPMHK